MERCSGPLRLMRLGRGESSGRGGSLPRLRAAPRPPAATPPALRPGGGHFWPLRLGPYIPSPGGAAVAGPAATPDPLTRWRTRRLFMTQFVFVFFRTSETPGRPPFVRKSVIIVNGRRGRGHRRASPLLELDLTHSSDARRRTANQPEGKALFVWRPSTAAIRQLHMLS